MIYLLRVGILDTSPLTGKWKFV